MAKQKVKMKEVMGAFFKYKTAESGWHKTGNGHYYKGDLLATITKTKFIINPNKQLWPQLSFHWTYAGQLLAKYLIDYKIISTSYWGSEWPLICNEGWGYVWKSMIFNFPLIINRRTKKIENKIDHSYIINKFKLARSLYNIDNIAGCANSFNISIPENIINKKKDILCKQLSSTNYFSNRTLDTLLKLKTNENDITNIKNIIKTK